MPRPTRLTPARAERIAKRIENGMTFAGACEADGVPRASGYRWMNRGADEDAPDLYRSFRDAVVRGRAIDEEKRIQSIADAGEGGFVLEEVVIEHPDGKVEKRTRRQGPDWRASAWHLERTRPKEYGRRMVLSGDGEGGAIPVDVRASALESIASKLSLMSERLDEAGGDALPARED